MRIRKRIILGILGVLLFASCKQSKQHQNIVLVIADDLGVPQVSCYGGSYYKTPNIDKLAQQGALFANAYSAAAVCSPTRAAIFTGKNPARLHITDFIPGGNSKKHALLPPDWQKHLPLEETTIGELLLKEGYKTALFGKWHLSKEKTPPKSREHNPDKQGFNETFVTYKPTKSLPIGEWQMSEKDAHSVDTITNRAIRFVKENKDSPFFLVVSHNSIHDPLKEKKSAIERFKNLPGVKEKENHPVIAAMVERLDNSFGRLVETIEDLNLTDNTVIIFYSDNGAKHSYAKQTPFKKGKGWLYEGGIRVPLIVKWKGKIKENSVLNTNVTSMDLFSTILEIAAGSDQTDEAIDGVSLVPLFSEKDLAERNLYWNYPHYHGGSGMPPAAAIRSGDYKLIRWYEPYLLEKDSIYELYNLADDIGESNNLANEFPEKVKELESYLDEWKSEVNAQEPLINSEYVSKTKSNTVAK